MNTAPEMLRSLSDRLAGTAHVQNVFGEAIVLGEKTIIPVARVGYGLGAGAGGKAVPGEASGGGGGGGVGAVPAGVLEIGPQGTRFIAFPGPWRWAVAALAAGLVAGFFLARRRQA